jgi:uncharacterized glyoxalase superfamily protein PhnB
MTTLNAIAPCFAVADVGATIRWYEEKLEFKGDPFPEFEPYVFAILQRDGVEIMLQRLEDYQKPDLYAQRSGGVWDAYVRVTGVREYYEAVREKVEIVKALRQQPYGACEFEVKDLNGYILVFSEITG